MYVGHEDVYLTTHGFAKSPSGIRQKRQMRSQTFGEEGLWSYGEGGGYGGGGECKVRCVGGSKPWGEGRVGVCEDGRECCGMEEVHVSRA